MHVYTKITQLKAQGRVVSWSNHMNVKSKTHLQMFCNMIKVKIGGFTARKRNQEEKKNSLDVFDL